MLGSASSGCVHLKVQLTTADGTAVTQAMVRAYGLGRRSPVAASGPSEPEVATRPDGPFAVH